MRNLVVALGLLVALVLGLIVGLRSPRAARATLDVAPAAGAIAPGESARVQALAAALDEERVRGERLELELAALRATVEKLAGMGRSAAAPGEVVEVVAGEHDAAWYLEQYVRSFDGGGTGSEYFRLAVQAYVIELVDPIARLVRSRDAKPLLRTNLAGILGDARLREDPRALAALFATLAPAEQEALALAGVQALRVIAGEAQLDEFVGRVFRVEHESVRNALIALALDLAGDEPNRVVAALLRLAPDARAELALIAELRTHDLDGALECFQFVSYREVPTRLAGARRTHEFRNPNTIALVDEWAAREPDEEVRRVLIGAREQLAKIPGWAPEQAIGAPNAPNPQQDCREAWAPAAARGGPEWIELDFEPALRAREVQVHEVCTAGALRRVVLVDEGGVRHTVWEGVDPLTQPGLFVASFAPTSYRVRSVRLELDTSTTGGWNEIDAVQLLGPDGVSWASGARASSYYGAGSDMARMNFGSELFLLGR